MDFKRDESLQKRKNTGYSDTARIMRRALGVTAMRGSDFDPDGSYTGVCDNIYEKPVQDADDLSLTLEISLPLWYDISVHH